MGVCACKGEFVALMDFLLANWRDAVLILVSLCGVYLVLTLMRLLAVGKRAARREPEPRRAPAANVDMIDLSLNRPVMPATDVVVAAGRAEQPGAPPAVGPGVRLGTLFSRPTETPVAKVESFVEELARSNMEVELQQLRRESGALRDQLEQVRQELERLKAARNVSPLYSEAMSLAQRGVTADGIAGQCGISLGEAELVAALAQSHGEPGGDDDFAFGEDGNGGYPSPRRRTGTHG